MDVTTKQCIDSVCRTKSIPLYLKLLDFMDRHYNYSYLVHNIIKDSDTDKEKVLKLFEWTQNNLRRLPEGFSIIDDHAWNIIIRGYGVSDQFSDVFTTLCNYAGIPAYFKKIYQKNSDLITVFSFVKVKKRWRVFDPYRGAYFTDRNGDFADIDDFRNNNWQLQVLTEKEIPRFNYKVYLENLPTPEDVGLTRPSIQSPMRRLIFEIKNLTKIHRK